MVISEVDKSKTKDKSKKTKVEGCRVEKEKDARPKDIRTARLQ
jgi:hypothetical protein